MSEFLEHTLALSHCVFVPIALSMYPRQTLPVYKNCMLDNTVIAAKWDHIITAGTFPRMFFSS